MLALLLLLELLLLLNEFIPRVIVQIEFECFLAVEAFVGLREGRPLVLDLLDLVEMLFELLARVRRPIPARCFFDDRHDRLVLNNRVDVNGVVHAAEDATLIRVAHVQVVQ